MKRAIWIIALILLFSYHPSTIGNAAAQESPVTLEVEVGFEGAYRQAHWTPMRVTVANTGSDLDGEIVTVLGDQNSADRVEYRVPVSLPGQSRKTVTILLGFDSYQSRLDVHLESDDQTLAKTSVRPNQVGNQTALIALLADEPIDLSFLSRSVAAGESVKTVYLAPADLPATSTAWSALDVLIINDMDTQRLSPDQIEALRGWLSAGGHLVATGGPNWQKTSSGLEDLLPVTPYKSASVDDLRALDRLGAQLAKPLPPGPFIVAMATPGDGRILIEQDDFPLLARKMVGLGTVDWLALDLAMAPLPNWPGNERLWSTILTGKGEPFPWTYSPINGWAAREGLKSIPSLALPSALQMVFFLLSYTLLIGPVNYFVLRRFKRTELAWFSIPTLILLFSLLAYISGFELRGGTVVVNRLSLVYGTTDSPIARARTLLGIFSPTRSSYDIAFPEGTVARPLSLDNYGGGMGSGGSTYVEQSSRFILRDVQVDVAGLQALQAESDVKSPEIVAQLDIEVEEKTRLIGSLVNKSEVIFLHTGLLVGGGVFELGALGPGQSVLVNELLKSGQAAPSKRTGNMGMAMVRSTSMPFPGYLPIETLVGGTDYGGDKALNRRIQILQAFAGNEGMINPYPQDAIFFGWSEQSINSIDVFDQEEETIDTVAYFLEIPLSLRTTAETMTIPPALTTWRTINDQWSVASNPYDLFLSSGWVSFEYQPWTALARADVQELILYVSSQSGGTPGGNPTIRLSLWDWEKEEWFSDELWSWGENHIPATDSLVGPENAVRVRVENPSSNGMVVRRLDVTFVCSVNGNELTGDSR